MLIYDSCLTDIISIVSIESLLQRQGFGFIVNFYLIIDYCFLLSIIIHLFIFIIYKFYTNYVIIIIIIILNFINICTPTVLGVVSITGTNSLNYVSGYRTYRHCLIKFQLKIKRFNQRLLKL